MKHPPKGEVVLCFPGAVHWELWTSDGSGGLMHDRVGKGNHADSPAAFKGVTHYAFPVSGVLCSPFWAASEDDSLLPDLVDLRLETQGLRVDPGMGARHFDFSLLDRDHNRSLLQPIIVPDNRPVILPKGDADVFDITPNYLPLPRQHLVLWKELGKWVAVATRNGKPVYFQGLTSQEIDDDALLELKCFVLQLHTQGVIDNLSGVIVWDDDLSEGSRRLLEQELEMPVHAEERPRPLLPEEPLDLLPKEVAINRSRTARRQKIRNWVSLAAMLYLAGIAFFAVQFVLKKRKVTTLKTEVAQLQREVGWIEPAAQRWNALEDAVNVDRYPLEMLYRVTLDMPETGIRLLDIDITNERIVLKGEGTNVTMVRSYLAKLKNSKLLTDYEWEGPPPKMDKTGVTTFEVTGRYIYGAS